MQFDPDTALLLERPRAESAHLWARASALLACVIKSIVSPVHLARSGYLARNDRRELNWKIAPIEALVRALLMADAIAWLIGTDAGAAMMRDARHHTVAEKPRRTVPAKRHAETDPSTDETAMSAEIVDDPVDAIAPVPDIEPVLDEEEMIRLALSGLNFSVYESTGFKTYDVDAPKRTPSHPPAKRRNRRRRMTAAMRLARRIEALRRLIAKRRRIMLIIARDLARMDLGGFYVPGARNWIDQRWPHGRLEIRAARSLSSPRFCYLMETRDRNDILALPPPQPG